MSSGAMDRQLTIINRLGLHARPAMQFVDVANQYQSGVKVCKGDQVVDGKSIMQMIMLAATEGTVLKVVAEGPDAEATLEALDKLVKGKFGEEE